jgi:drug/metabolite transporter (DMT)-like permease
MIGETLALLSAAASGISVVLVRKHSANSSVLNMSIVITIVGMAALWPLAIATTDFAAVNVWGFLLFALSGLLSPGFVRLFYYKGLKTLGASVNSSVFAVYPLYSSLLAILLLSEILTAWNVFGIAAIILGVVFVEMSINGKYGHGKIDRHNIIVPVLGGVTLGFATLFRKFALDTSNIPIMGVAIAYVFSLLPYIVILAFSSRSRQSLSLKQDFRWFWAAGIGQAVSWLLAFYALSFSQVSITTPLLAVEPLFVVAFAYFYLKEVEHVSAKLIASVAVTVLGVVLITI